MKSGTWSEKFYQTEAKKKRKKDDLYFRRINSTLQMYRFVFVSLNINSF